VRHQQAYEASTMSLARIGRAMIGSGSFATPRAVAWTVGAVSLEAAARLLGHYDHLRKRSHHIWDPALTSKQQIGSPDSQGLQAVLVFNVVNHHRLLLELGPRMARQLTQRVTRCIEHSVDPRATVTAQPSGTVVVVLPIDRMNAERAAQTVVEDIARQPLLFDRGRERIPVKLACGIIAFSNSGEAHAESISPQLPAVGPAAIAS
jgi:hypothetical protein